MTTQKLESIIELASALARQSDFQEVLRLITRKASVLFNAETALIMMVNPSTRETIKTIYKLGSPGDDRNYQIIHTYLTGWVIENNTGFVTGDIKRDRRFRTELVNESPVKSVMCGPFRGDGVITGTLLLLCRSTDHTFSQTDYLLLEKFTAIASPFLQNTQKIQPYFESHLPKATLLKKYEGHGLLGKSEPFLSMLQSVEAAAKSDVRVLLEGESGTGKELIAKAIHHCSARSQYKFIAIDCGAIPRELVESELFGHVKGAFTGAGESRKGLMEEADKGTLFMDEIPNLPLEMQSKLLRVLQEKEIRPLGSNQIRKVDIRIITASSKSLRKLIEKGEFREDLFYRLYVYPIEIPSLNQRKKDISLLANHFLRKFSREQQKQLETYSPEIMEFFKKHDWTGNVRELENLVERLVTLAPREMRIMDIRLLPLEFQPREGKKQASPQPAEDTRPLKETLAAYEKQAIENLLVLSDWNQSKAARRLKISEHAIRYKMKKLGIQKP